MASIKFGPFGDNWFKKPPNPFTPINLLSVAESLNPFKPQRKTPLKFASISTSTPFQPPKDKPQEKEEEEPGEYMKMLEQFYWESENRPDYRHTPEVEKILDEDDSIFEKKDNPTPEEVEENKKWWNEFRDSPVVQFLQQAHEIADKLNEMELKENSSPYRGEDEKYWKAIPNVMGLDGRPMPRKAIKTDEESDDKFWDFTKQFFFGLWNFKQRPYPRGRPIDVAQAIGFKQLERRYYDFIMRSGGWYYKDRLGRTRGPMELIQLKTAWGGGIIDKHTFIWGEDMDEWAPIGMIYGMERAIATWEVRLGAAATAFIHKLQKGIPPWVPLKGHENKTYAQVQKEAYENKRRDLAVLEANDGVWPGVRIPSHALFLWASGSELTSILEADHMPNKYIPEEIRLQLAKVIPGLRPWEVLSIEQAMDQITYGGEWYREPLGTHRTGPPYIKDWNRFLKRFLKTFGNVNDRFAEIVERAIPGYRSILQEYVREAAARKQRKEKEKMARDLSKCVSEVSTRLGQGNPYFPPE